MRQLVDAVVQLAALAPAVRVVVADDVQQIEKLHRRGFRLGRDLVAGGGHRTGGIFAMEDGQQVAQNLHAVRR